LAQPLSVFFSLLTVLHKLKNLLPLP
jgi:hypothetical protein